jgi:ribosomal protein L33
MNTTPLGLNLCRLKNFVQWVWIIYKLLIPSTSVIKSWQEYLVSLKASVCRTEGYNVMVNSKELIGKVQLKRNCTRWRTGGKAKGKLVNGVGSQYPSHYLGTRCIQHYYRWCAHLGCQYDWIDAPADLNGLVRFAERRNLVSALVPSHFQLILPINSSLLPITLFRSVITTLLYNDTKYPCHYIIQFDCTFLWDLPDCGLAGN